MPNHHITSDQLQNELLNIAHHLDDMKTAINSGELDYALEGLKDAREAVERLNGFLPNKMAGEIERMAESLDPPYDAICG